MNVAKDVNRPLILALKAASVFMVEVIYFSAQQRISHSGVLRDLSQ